MNELIVNKNSDSVLIAPTSFDITLGSGSLVVRVLCY